MAATGCRGCLVISIAIGIGIRVPVLVWELLRVSVITIRSEQYITIRLETLSQSYSTFSIPITIAVLVPHCQRIDVNVVVIAILIVRYCIGGL